MSFKHHSHPPSTKALPGCGSSEMGNIMIRFILDLNQDWQALLSATIQH